MVKALNGPTWALLSPSNLPDASECPKILGAIVPDYEHPSRNSIPTDAAAHIPSSCFANPTNDENFKVSLIRASSDNARYRLGEILKLTFGKDAKNELHLTSTLVRTYAVRQEETVFSLLRSKFKNEILERIEKAPSRNHGAVFAIVALKTCQDAEIHTADSKKTTSTLDIKPPAQLITAASGFPIPTKIDLGADVTSEQETLRDKNQVATGERIFAVQYRLVRKQSQWSMLGKPKLPADFELKDYFIPNSPAMFGGDTDNNDVEVSVGDNDDEVSEQEGGEIDDDDDDDDPLQLGDIEHTWSLQGSSDADGLVMTTL